MFAFSPSGRGLPLGKGKPRLVSILPFFFLFLVPWAACQTTISQEPQGEKPPEGGRETSQEALADAASESPPEPTPEAAPEVEALRWEKALWEADIPAGRLFPLDLPKRLGGKEPITLRLAKAIPEISTDKGLLFARLAYQGPTEIQAQVIAEDSQGQTAALEIRLRLVLPKMEPIPIPTQQGPSARANPALALSGQTLLVFGGYLESGLGSSEMWLLDQSANQWTLATPEGDQPPAYGAFRIAVTSERAASPIEGVILQGSNAQGNQINPHVFRFQIQGGKVVWKRLLSKGETPSPNLFLSSFGYDQKNKRFLLFGGIIIEARNDLFTFTLQGEEVEWKKHVLPGGPGPRYASLYVVDPKGERLLIASGDTLRTGAERFPADLWSLSFAGELWWDEITVSGTYQGRRNGILLLDTPGDRLFLWGGARDSSAPLELKAVHFGDSKPMWETVPFQGPDPRTSVHSASDPSSGQSIFGFGRDPSFLRDLWSFQPTP